MTRFSPAHTRIAIALAIVASIGWSGCGEQRTPADSNRAGQAPLDPLTYVDPIYPCRDGIVDHGTSDCSNCYVGTVNTTGTTGNVVGDSNYSGFCGEKVALISFPLLLDEPILDSHFHFSITNSLQIDDVTTPQVEVWVRKDNGGRCPVIKPETRCETWTSLGTFAVSLHARIDVTVPAADMNPGGYMQFMITDASVYGTGGGSQWTTIAMSEWTGTTIDPLLEVYYDF